MIHSVIEWISDNYIELLGALLGFVYIFLSIRQNILTWPVGLLSSVFYILVFFQAKVYAGMSLQVYYAAMSIYGWYYWKKGDEQASGGKLCVRTVKKTEWFSIAVFFVVVFALLSFLLTRYTDTDVAVFDSITTTASIIATWMMARKMLENWIIWVITDLTSVFLFVEKNLWVTAVLYLVFTIMAVVGYFEWKKTFKISN